MSEEQRKARTAAWVAALIALIGLAGTVAAMALSSDAGGIAAAEANLRWAIVRWVSLVVFGGAIAAAFSYWKKSRTPPEDE